MVSIRRALCALIAALLWPVMASAQDVRGECADGDGVCVLEEDLMDLVTIAKEHKCLHETKPKLDVDEVTIITDVDGRIFHTGADPGRPFKIMMSWCDYEVLAEGKVNLIAAKNEPDTWGFRFRPKAYLGYLVSRAFDESGSAGDGIDAGLLLDFFHVEWVNVNAAAGFRSVGAGVGFDLTTNFGAHVAYGLGWGRPLHNIGAGVYFAF